jgi:hypothetical protein
MAVVSSVAYPHVAFAAQVEFAWAPLAVDDAPAV